MATPDRRTFLHQTGGLLAGLSLIPEEVTRGVVYRPPAPLTVGLVGAGRQGRQILAELAKLPDVRVAAVCEPDTRRLRRSLRRTRDAKGYATIAEMLEKETAITAVMLATPTHLHKEPALELLAAGKHVYCEAPMASSLDDLRALAKAGRDAKTVFQVGHYSRSNPVYRLARSFFRAGSIETLISLKASFHVKSSWRTPVSGDAERAKAVNWRLFASTSSGLPGEEGSHLIDTIGWYTSKRAASVRGRGGIMLYPDGREVADTVTCQYEYPDGVSLVFDGTLANSYESTHQLFVGTMGTIKLAGTHGWLFKEADAPVQGWEVYANRQQFHDEQGITLIADATKLASQGKLKEGIGLPHPPLYYALESFLKSASEGTKVMCTAQHGLEAAVIALKGHEAVVKGTDVDIPDSLFQVG